MSAVKVAASEGRLLLRWLTDAIGGRLEASGLGEAARREPREARLDAVQLVYAVAALTGQPPAKAIERELNMTQGTATNWIRLARDAGRLAGLGYSPGRPPRQ